MEGADQISSPKRTETGSQGTLSATAGDFLLSEDTLPLADNIVMLDFERKHREFHPDALRDYLSFLELVVLNERLIIGFHDVIGPLDQSLKQSEAFSSLFDVFRFAGALDLESQVLETLQDRAILFYAKITLERLSPEDYVTKYLTLSDAFRRRFKELIKFCKDYEKDPTIRERLVMARLSRDVGMPLHLAEFARHTKLPYLLGDRELSAVAPIESLESGLRRNVTAHLRDSLNAGARRELDRLVELGERTIFPETPIAWQIVMEANTPDDLLLTALQLRDEYKGFRNQMVELETELLREDTSLKRKLKVQRQVASFAEELWPANTSGIRKEATEISDLLMNIVGVEAFSVGGAAKLTQLILSKPVDLVLKALRRRKIRVLLKTRKEFLNAKGWSTKLASVFQLPKTTVDEALTLRK